ncbi:MAG: MFS transporter, partial [Candidatus Nanosynbacter sp.]|nr:MFS transporter [Candidatus Nanosynbacter sp.]
MLHHLPQRHKLIVMLAVMSALFLVALDQTIVATALGAIVKEFNSFSSLGFIVTAYMLTTTVTVPLAGKLSDMYGRKPLLLSGVAIFTIGSLLSGIAPTVEWLIAWRALQGIGGGIITANAFTIVGDLFTPKERGRWQGLIGATFGMSSVAGPLLGGWLTDGTTIFGVTTNWRWTFFINVPIGIIATVLIIRYCPQIKHDSKHKPDYLGALFITIALAALVLAVDNTEMVFKSLIDQGIALALIKSVLLAIAALAGGIFLWLERKAAQPILPLRFFRNSTYRLIMLISLLFGAAFLGAILYLTQFNQQVFGATASQAGLMLLPMVGGMMISSIGVGQLISRTGVYKRYIVIGCAITAASILSLITL